MGEDLSFSEDGPFLKGKSPSGALKDGRERTGGHDGLASLHDRQTFLDPDGPIHRTTTLRT
ncbi:hypothetical protein AD929_12355 [Gluconobacter potus]|uniref:Uncharacterized protein n=1 Tax=Gluconobacter potus TaxID=2724927 RepID=A0A149QRU5_9PROT|nr:hypothetical protein AD929_12355 [Gluconobacter potus]